MSYDWAVVGAGPAGIAVIGKLLDNGVPAKKIAWVDPAFAVGKFGTLWREVPSNTKAKLFTQFLQASKSFQYDNADVQFALRQADPNDTCQLSIMAEPLQWVTNHLKQQVSAHVDQVSHVQMQDCHWNLSLQSGQSIAAKRTVLAIGAVPKTLDVAAQQELPIADVFCADKLIKAVSADDTVAVFGSSHSAILAVRRLLEKNVKQVVNFYLEPLRYAVDMGDWILFDDTGLKGTTATWAHQHIDGQLPKNLSRYYSNKENIAKYLPTCNKVVFAVGFQRVSTLTVEHFPRIHYNDKSGIIAPGLFGFGIAFPEGKTNPFGMLEHRVGLWKFMDYLKRVLPVWMKYGP